MKLDEALAIAENSKWHGSIEVQEAAKILAKEVYTLIDRVNRLQDKIESLELEYRYWETKYYERD